MFKKIVVLSSLAASCISFGMVRFASPPIQTSSATGTEPRRIGKLCVFTGPMACGKTDTLMSHIETWRIGDKKVLVGKHSFDTRSATYLTTRRGIALKPIEAVAINNPQEILERVAHNPVDYVALDEVQFFPKKPMAAVIKALKHLGIYIAVSGLDQDFKGEPFGESAPEPLCMPWLMCNAEEVVKYQAICMVCKEWNATMTQRLVNGQPARKNDPLVVIDDGTKKEISYEPRCVGCHILAD